MTVDDPREWLAYAEEDFAALDDLLASDQPRWRHICYLAQQAGEKMLKAYLVSRSVVPPKTHDLNRLLSLISGFQPESDQLLSSATLLTSYAAATRYPGDAPMPTSHEGAAARTAAQQIRDRVQSWLDHDRSKSR
jgi:HEPN domain-containing protein